MTNTIPWQTIGVQAFNLGLLLAVLFYFLRKVVVEHFASRCKAYTELVDRAETAKAQAEKSHREISSRLKDLQATAEASLKQAEREAAELKVRMLNEAQQFAKKLEEDAHRTVNQEIERSKLELRAELLRTAIESSRESLHKSLGAHEQKRLQTEFMDKIQVVG